MLSPTERFSNRVENYVRYRPAYPNELINLLRRECGLSPDSVVADVGSGTGKLSELILEVGCQVFGVEPNREMREAGEYLLERFSRFASIAAPAEATTLPAASIDVITAGQAFHWFDCAATRLEFKRILKSGGSLALIWNERRADSTFASAYEELIQNFATDYARVNHRNVNAACLREFFGVEPVLKKFRYSQWFNFDGLKGRLLSSSYAPEKDEAGHDEMLRRLREIFDEHNANGEVGFDYNTLIYYGRFSAR